MPPNIYYCAYIFTTIFILTTLLTKGNCLHLENDKKLIQNSRSLLALNISYNESQKVYEMLKQLKSSYLNYSEEINNMYFFYYFLKILIFIYLFLL